MKKALYTNNARKMNGIPLMRKASRGKRSATRCEQLEAVAAFLDYSSGRAGAYSYYREDKNHV
jgi:hypothetical protein